MKNCSRACKKRKTVLFLHAQTWLNDSCKIQLHRGTLSEDGVEQDRAECRNVFLKHMLLVVTALLKRFYSTVKDKSNTQRRFEKLVGIAN